MEKIDYKIIDGKPHFGAWAALWSHIDSDTLSEKEWNDPNDPAINLSYDVLERRLPKDLEYRNMTRITRPPRNDVFYEIKGTIALKFIAYGRAFKVHAFGKSDKRKPVRWKKVWLNGRRRRMKC